HQLQRAGRGRYQRGPRPGPPRGGTPHRQAARHPSIPALAHPRSPRVAREADRGSRQGRAEPMRPRPLARGLAVALAALVLAVPTVSAVPTQPVELTALFVVRG